MTDIGKGVRCNCEALKRASRRVSLIYDRELALFDVTSGQYAILDKVRRADDTLLTVGELAKILVMDRTALSHTLRPLERDGLLEMQEGPIDKRQKMIRLTRTGRDRLEAASAGWGRAQSIIDASIGEENARAMRALVGFLERIEIGEGIEN
jgi:DNA-binding MarR family transcriptional regulator